MKSGGGVWGMSFTEILVSILVLSIGVIPAMIVLSRGNVGTMMTRDEILAHQYAAELVDYTQALGFDHAEQAGVSGSDIREIDIQGKVSQLPPGFSRFLEIHALEPGTDAADWPLGVKVIRVKVTWMTGKVAQQFILTGLLQKGREES